MATLILQCVVGLGDRAAGAEVLAFPLRAHRAGKAQMKLAAPHTFPGSPRSGPVLLLLLSPTTQHVAPVRDSARPCCHLGRPALSLPRRLAP